MQIAYGSIDIDPSCATDRIITIGETKLFLGGRIFRNQTTLLDRLSYGGVQGYIATLSIKNLPNMLRAAASAGRIVTRGARVLPRNTLPAVAVSVQRLGYKSLAPTTPRGVKASTPDLNAAASETPATTVAAGKISQVIGAVVDVHFGMSSHCFYQ